MGNRNVTICASSTFVQEAEEWKDRLEKRNFNVIKIPLVLQSNYEEIHKIHYQKIAQSDIILVLNLKKHERESYIGPSVFAEIAFAIGLNLALNNHIEVFSVNVMPDDLPYSEELLLWERLGWIKKWEEKEQHYVK